MTMGIEWRLPRIDRPAMAADHGVKNCHARYGRGSRGSSVDIDTVKVRSAGDDMDALSRSTTKRLSQALDSSQNLPYSASGWSSAQTLRSCATAWEEPPEVADGPGTEADGLPVILLCLPSSLAEPGSWDSITRGVWKAGEK